MDDMWNAWYLKFKGIHHLNDFLWKASYTCVWKYGIRRKWPLNRRRMTINHWILRCVYIDIDIPTDMGGYGVNMYMYYIYICVCVWIYRNISPKWLGVLSKLHKITGDIHWYTKCNPTLVGVAAPDSSEVVTGEGTVDQQLRPIRPKCGMENEKHSSNLLAALAA